MIDQPITYMDEWKNTALDMIDPEILNEDAWWKMALETQFLNFLPEELRSSNQPPATPVFPSTLMYLEKNSGIESLDSRWILDEIMQELHASLMAKTYIRTLALMLWKEALLCKELEDPMTEILCGEEELIHGLLYNDPRF